MNVECQELKKLLVRMESIIGNECYNQYALNFRYPVTIEIDEKYEKFWNISSTLDTETLVASHYKFGSNKLYIFSALVKIVEMLKTEYNFRIE